MKATNWDNEEIAKLLVLKGQGKTFHEIAKILGKGYNPVRMKYYNTVSSPPSRIPKNRKPWTEKEEDFLLRLAKQLPRILIIQHYNQAAKEYGFPPRTASAINLKLWQLGQPADSQKGYYTRKSIAAGLGFSVTKINNWIKDGGLQGFRDNKVIYISRDNLIHWIVSNPGSIRGITEPGMMWFLSLLKDVFTEGDNRDND